MQVPPLAKLDIDVPEKVINALWNALNYVKTIDSNDLKIFGEFDYDVFHLQYINEKYKKMLDSSISGIRHYHVESLKLRTNWISDNDDFKVIKDFLDDNFSSYFQFKIDELGANVLITPHPGHFWPRVFIPMHENNSTFVVLDDNGTHKMRFEYGGCYIFDVSKMHGVDNTQGLDRTMALFCFDPSLEVKMKILPR